MFMKTYKLIKDLPRAKAGEVVIITNAHSNNPWILKINKWNEDETQRPRLAFIHKNDISEWLEEVKPKTIWDLEEWDDFYFIINSSILENIVTDCEDFKDYLKEWNVFLTKKEAEQELEKRQAIQRIKKYCFENNIRNKDFKPHEHNYTILYDDLDKNFFIEYYEVSYFINDLWYFKTYEDCKKIIDNCDADLKIIFNV